jgi:hypothetical protein
VADKLHIWSIIPYDKYMSGGLTELCKLFENTLFDLVIDFLLGSEKTIDDLDATKSAINNIPSGASVLNFIHYG